MTVGLSDYEPDYSVSPGMLLAEHLEVQRISPAELARRCGRPVKLIGGILAEKAPLEPRTAVQFEKVLGVSARIWIGAEADYQLRRAHEAEIGKDARISKWADTFPVKALVARGFFDKPSSSGDAVYKLLSFFGVASLEAWNDRYKSADVTHRNSPDLGGSEADLITWLRLGEIQAEHQYTAVYNPGRFKTALRQVRKLTCLPIAEALESATELCNRAGVSLAVVRPLVKAAPHGAAWWMTAKRPVILLGAHHKSSDEIWFTFCHEAAHILLHGRKNVFVDPNHGGTDEMEVHADKWAANTLIPNRDWADFITRASLDEETIKGFAMSQGVAPGIVVGRLQHENLLSRRSMNHLKVSLPRKHMKSLDIEYKWVEWRHE